MNVLLINLPLEKNTPTPVFPLGLGYIAAVLKNEGHSVLVLDLNVDNNWDENSIERQISDIRYDIVGVSAMILNYSDIEWLSGIIHKHRPDVKIILGGSLGSSIPELVLRETSVDMIVSGEGENTAVDIINTMESKGDYENVPGIIYLKEGNVCRTETRKLIDDIDELPMPAWDMFNMRFYINEPTWLFMVPKADIVTTRGCPYNCTFCYKGTFGNKYRYRSAENIVKEIQVLQDEYGVECVTFQDDTFVFNRQRVIDLCGLLINKEIRIRWICNGRAGLLDDEMLALMHKAGCVSIGLGIETGDTEILKNIKKQITPEQVKDAVRAIKRNGMMVNGHAMIGFPGETRNEFLKSIEIYKGLGLTPDFNILTPIPGTMIYEEAVKNGKIKNAKDLLIGWSNWKRNIVVNLSDMTDEELVNTKRTAERILRKNMLLRDFKSVLRMYYIYVQINGWRHLLSRVTRSIKSILN